MAHFPGERILIGHSAAGATAPSDDRRDPITLHAAVTGEPSAAKPNTQAWRAVEVTAWDDPLPAPQGHVALIFDLKLLQGDGGPARIHTMLVERAKRHSR